MAKSENKRRTKGEGSLEFNEKKKKWVARITAHRADGSSFRKTFEGKTQKEAKSKRDEWLRHHKEESERIRSNEAFGKYVNEWMENVGRNGIKAQTYKRNVRTIRTYVVPYLGECRTIFGKIFFVGTYNFNVTIVLQFAVFLGKSF